MTGDMIGVDLGGTKIAATVMSLRGETRWKHRVPTPAGDYEGTLNAIEGLVRSAIDHGIDGVPRSFGIGIPGEMSSDGRTVKNANSTCLIGRPLQDDLQARLGMRVVIANDANCFALSEAMDGAGGGAGVVFGVILGTGVGGGIVVHKRLIAGANRLAGEWGHNPMPLKGGMAKHRPCYCGYADCVETWLSGPAFARDYQDRTGLDGTAIEIAKLAEDGDLPASEVLDTYITNLARALSGIVNVLDPDVIVLGGGMSNIDRIYSSLPDRLAGFVFNATDQPVDLQTRIVQARWGDDSGLRGAAWLTRLGDHA